MDVVMESVGGASEGSLGLCRQERERKRRQTFRKGGTLHGQQEVPDGTWTGLERDSAGPSMAPPTSDRGRAGQARPIWHAAAASRIQQQGTNENGQQDARPSPCTRCSETSHPGHSGQAAIRPTSRSRLEAKEEVMG